MAPRKDLAEKAMDTLIADMVSGKYPPGLALPSETDLSEALGVSRLTLREAIRTLRNKSVVRVRHGRGTYVNPIARWSVLDPQLLAARVGTGTILPKMLIEARTIIEMGVCELAAKRRSDGDLHDLDMLLDDMTEAAGNVDVDAFVHADLQFHQIIMEASGNPFITELFDPIGQFLLEARRQTSAVAQIRRNAIHHHRLILEALRSGDPEQSALAMRAHMGQTEHDVDHYIVKSSSAASPDASI